MKEGVCFANSLYLWYFIIMENLGRMIIMVKLIMHGCNGKMGQVISKIVKEDANAEIVAGVDSYLGIKNE